MSVLHREILPDNVVPRHYDIVLEVNLEKCIYKGVVTIYLDIEVDSNSVTLNDRGLTYESSDLEVDGQKIGAADSQTIDEKLERVAFSWRKDVLKSGSKAKLSINFDGILNDKFGGLYRAKYKDRSGRDRWMAATQMQPVDCRRAFPCFDEPGLKATFAMTVIYDPELTCVANMDVNKEYTTQSKFDGSPRKATLFNKTPKMSTYLVAIAVGQFDCIETNAFRVPIRAFVPPSERIETARHALDLTARTLEFYEKQFDCPFPLPKIDMVAVPGRTGAMENWGLVLYAPDHLLYDPQTDSAVAWSGRADVIQHELAHQWFGNIVTMEFWDGLWLNEGFATWMAKYSNNHFHPEWKIWQKYVGDNHVSALNADSVRSSHPIEVPVQNEGQINEIFDAISYLKGQAIIRMIVGYLGEDLFMKGIQRYFADHAYGSTRTVDLWNVLEEVSNQPVSRIMSIWTKKIGYPVVSVTELPENKIKLEQHRFLKTGDVMPEDDTTLYPIPIGLRTVSGVDKTLLLTDRSQEISVPDSDFFKLNADHIGFYRTSYSPERLGKLGENAKAGLLSVEDRAGLLSDAIALSIAGDARTSGVLAFIRNLGNEDNLVVWNVLSYGFESLEFAWKFEDDKMRKALRSLASDLWHATQTLLSFCYRAKYKAGEQNAIPPDLRSIVFNSTMKHGGETELDFFIELFKTGSTAGEKEDACLALGFVQSPKLVDRVLEYLLSDDTGPMHMFKVLMYLRFSPVATPKIWTWFQGNYDKILEKAPSGMAIRGMLVKFSFNGFTSLDKIAEVEEFFSHKDTSAYKLNLEQGLDQVRANAGWVNRDREDVRQYLKEVKLFVD